MGPAASFKSPQRTGQGSRAQAMHHERAVACSSFYPQSSSLSLHSCGEHHGCLRVAHQQLVGWRLGWAIKWFLGVWRPTGHSSIVAGHPRRRRQAILHEREDCPPFADGRGKGLEQATLQCTAVTE